MIGGPSARFFFARAGRISITGPKFPNPMKTLLIVLAALVLLICLVLAWLSWRAERPALGIVDGHLTACELQTNCVCSEYPGEASITPLAAGDTGPSMEAVAAALIEAGGVIEIREPAYLRAVFRSRWFRFADDVEFRWDRENRVIHVRSGARSGTSDLGVNRARVENIRTMLGKIRDE